MKQIENHIKYIGSKVLTLADNSLQEVPEFAYDLECYKTAFDDYYENIVQTEIVKNQLNQPVLKGTISIRIPLRKLSFFLFESGAFVVIRPNGKRSLYEYKSPKQLIAILNAIIRRAK